MRQLSPSAAAAFALCLLATGAARASRESGDESGRPEVQLRRSLDAVLQAAADVRGARRELGLAQARFDAAQRALDAEQGSRLDARELSLPPDGRLPSPAEQYRRALQRLEASEGRLGRAEDRLLVARRQLDEAAAARVGRQ